MKFVGDHTFFLLSWRDGHTHIYRYAYDSNNPLGSSCPARQPGRKRRLRSRSPSKPSTKPPRPSGTSPIRAIPRQQQIWAIQFDGTGRRQISQESRLPRRFLPRTGRRLHRHSFHPACPAHRLRLFRRRAHLRLTRRHLYRHSGAPTPAGPPPHRSAVSQLNAADKTTKLYGTLLLPPGQFLARTAFPSS